MKKFIALLLLISFSSLLFANSTSPEPYGENEFPDWANYLRRYEVITLGSLPFTTMGVTTIYTLYRYIDNDFDKKYIPNPFALTSSAANLDSDEQKFILLTAIGTSIVAGTVDLIIHVIKKEKAKKKNAQIFERDVIIQNKINELNESGQMFNTTDLNNSSYEEKELDDFKE
jgi:hypothetical protein